MKLLLITLALILTNCGTEETTKETTTTTKPNGPAYSDGAFVFTVPAFTLACSDQTYDGVGAQELTMTFTKVELTDGFILESDDRTYQGAMLEETEFFQVTHTEYETWEGIGEVKITRQYNGTFYGKKIIDNEFFYSIEYTETGYKCQGLTNFNAIRESA